MNISQEFQLLLANSIDFIPRLIAALVTFFVALFVANGLAKWILIKSREKIEKIETTKLLSSVTRWSVIILGIVLALEQVNFNVSGFIAGLGIAGFTIGFALQDISKNFISGILIIVQQPFRVGDAVELSDFQGKVIDITLRDTVVQTWDGEIVILPNSSVYSNPIKNFTGLKNRRRIIEVGVGYDVDLRKAQQVLLDSMRSTEGVLTDPEPVVFAKEFGDSAINLQAIFWVDQTQYSILQVPSDVILAIKEATQRESITIPYPIQTVQIPKNLPSN